MRKKLLLSTCLLAGVLLTSNSVLAEPSELFYYDNEFNLGTEEEPEMSPIFGLFNSVSANGQYAAGYDNFFSGICYTWDATSKSLTLHNAQYQFEGKFMAVSNDGTVYGAYRDDEGSIHPGFYKNGEWTALPLSENVYKPYLTDDLDYAPTAKAVSSDGKFIAGQACLEVGGTSKIYPLLWENGVLTTYDNLSLEGQGFIVADVSEDGSIIVGVAESQYGDWLPAIVVNGELKYIITLQELMDKFGAEQGAREFVTCQAFHIDIEGNITGFIQDPTEGSSVYYGFIYNEKTGYKELANIPTCSINANNIIGITSMPYGSPIYISNGEVEDLAKKTGVDETKSLTAIMDVSFDGKVMAGAGVAAIEGLGEANVPALIYYPEANPLGSVNAVRENGSSVVLEGNGVVSVTGDFTKIEVYSISGAQVASGVKGEVVSIENMPKGVYIVSLINGSERDNFKVIK